RPGPLRLAAELLVGERGLGLLVDDGCPGCVEEPDPAAVHVAVALHLQRVRRVDEPERRAHRMPSRVQPQQPAHDSAPFRRWSLLAYPKVPPGQGRTAWLGPGPVRELDQPVPVMCSVTIRSPSVSSRADSPCFGSMNHFTTMPTNRACRIEPALRAASGSWFGSIPRRSSASPLAAWCWTPARNLRRSSLCSIGPSSSSCAAHSPRAGPSKDSIV